MGVAGSERRTEERPSTGAEAAAPRVLVVGWFSFLHGEATAGDVGAAEAVRQALDAERIPHETAWSPVMEPGGPSLGQVDSAAFSHLVFVCGPLHGSQVEELHRRFAGCVRIAVGVTVVDPGSPAVAGFHHVVPRDAPGAAARPDTAAAAAPRPAVPVVGVIASHDQPEYGDRSRHADVHHDLATWLTAQDCARVRLDTRLTPGDWALCSTTGQFDSLLGRMDAIVTTRLHGLVLGLRAGVPVLAVDPVEGGAKLAAQGRALDWPVLTLARGTHGLDPAELDRRFRWCLSPAAAPHRVRFPATPSLAGLVAAIRSPAPA